MGDDPPSESFYAEPGSPGSSVIHFENAGAMPPRSPHSQAAGEAATPDTVRRSSKRAREAPPSRAGDCLAPTYTERDLKQSIFGFLQQGGDGGKMSRREAARQAGIPLTSWGRGYEKLVASGEVDEMELCSAQIAAAPPPQAESFRQGDGGEHGGHANKKRRKGGRPSAAEVAQRPHKDTGVTKAVYSDALHHAVRLYQGREGGPRMTAPEAAAAVEGKFGANIKPKTIWESSRTNKEGQRPQSVGRPPALAADVEEKLVLSIEAQRTLNIPVWSDVFLADVNNMLFHDPRFQKLFPKGFGRKWLKRFLARHKDRLQVKSRAPPPLPAFSCHFCVSVLLSCFLSQPDRLSACRLGGPPPWR